MLVKLNHVVCRMHRYMACSHLPMVYINSFRMVLNPIKLFREPLLMLQLLSAASGEAHLKKNIIVQGSYSSYMVLKSGTAEMSTR